MKSFRAICIACCLLILSVLPARASSFSITLNLDSALDSYQSIFEDAKNYWESVIKGYKVDRHYLNGITMNATGYTGEAGGVLGSAGIDAKIQSSYTYSTTGYMEFDTLDLVSMSSQRLYNVVRHEMAHVIGFGLLWDDNGIYDTNNPDQYTGAAALAAYRNEFDQPGAPHIPVEVGGGAGTAQGHWNEVNGGGDDTGLISSYTNLDMRYELMTGWLNTPSFVSRATIQSFADIGYVVVPVPGAFLLLGAGISGIFALRRRK